MAETRSGHVDQWREHVDELCHDGETVVHRVELEDATLAVTNQRVMAFTPQRGEPNFRHVDRPNVGTITVETTGRLRRLCVGLVAAFAGVGLLELATDVRFAAFAPDLDFGDVRSMPGATRLTRVVEIAVEAVETALLLVKWSVLLSGVAALAVAAFLVISFLRSRSRRLVLRVSGGDDLEFSIGADALERGVVADLENAIRPESAALEGRGDGESVQSTGERRTGGERAAGDRIGAEESG